MVGETARSELKPISEYPLWTVSSNSHLLFKSYNLSILTVDMDIELLRVVGRHPVEGLADVGAHVGAVDVRDVQHGRGHEAR